MAYTNRISSESFTLNQKYGQLVAPTYGSALRKYDVSKSGQSVPNYKELIRLNLQASSPYVVNGLKLARHKPMGCSATFRRKPQFDPNAKPFTEIAEGMISTPPSSLTHSVVSQSKARSIALSKIYNKIKEEQNHMNSPAVLAEFGDVIRQFGKPADALVDLTNRRLNRLELERRGLKGSTAFKRVRWSEIVASTYLEWSFGLDPIVDETKRLAETVARWKYEETEGANPKFRKRIQSRGTDTLLTKTVTNSGVSSTWIATIKSDVITTEARAQYTVGMQQTLTAAYGSNERLLQLLGFDHGNWIPAAWEVVPWSWLLDYFLNVQQILDAAVTSTAGVRWISLAETLKTSLEHTTTIDEPRTRNSAGINGYDLVSMNTSSVCSFKLVNTSMVRSLPQSLGIPPLTISVPTGGRKLANMVAVLFARKPSSSKLWIT